MPEVEAVVVHWRRPENILPIISRLREQTVPPTVTVVDASNTGGVPLPNTTKSLADRVYTLSRNLGSWNRYVPIGGYDHRYTWFIDDDLLPSKSASEKLLGCVKSVNDFGVLGPSGRIVAADGTYSPYAVVEPASVPQVADIVVRSYFLRTSSLPQVLRTKHMLSDRNVVGQGNDDLVACVGIRLLSGRLSYVVPFQMIDRELAEHEALWRRPEHISERTATCRALIGLGWRPRGR